MKNRSLTFQEMKEKLIQFFNSRDEIVFAYLFGSAARGEQNSLSDIDIAVAINPARVHESDYPFGYASAITSLLMEVLENNRIDVVLLSEAPPVLRHRIFAQGIRIFSRNSEAEKQAFIRAFHEYQDTAPLRRIQHFYLNRYLKKLGAPRFHG